MKKEKTSVAHRVWTVIGVVLCVILIPILIINCTLLIRGATKTDRVPSIGGIFPMIVLTDSMSGTFESGDLVICKTADPADIQVGDVICFYDPASSDAATVTHRVTAVTTDADGGLAWVTKGDANNAEDSFTVSADKLVGRYQFRLAGLGRVALFMQSTPGLILCVGCPVVILLGYDFFRRRSYEKRQRQDREALVAELEQLRAEKGKETQTAAKN